MYEQHTVTIEPAKQPINVDVAIVGAGVAGLWLANVLAQRGLAVAVCEAAAVGGVQTIAAQGIVHSGAKYALGGGSAAADALRTMPARWRAALDGEGEIDLRGVPVLADAVQLWCATGAAMPRARLAGWLAGPSERRWRTAAGPFGRGRLLALDDFVIDVPTLIRQLAAPLRNRFLAARVAADDIKAGGDDVAGIDTATGSLHAAAYVFAAGAGNAVLASAAGFDDVQMVRRPLNQTTVQLRQPARVFAHCLARPFGLEPDLTVTSHGPMLYVGGRVASAGVGRSASAQLAAVRRLLRKALPEIDLAGAEFRIHTVDRAEPAKGGHRRGDMYVAQRGNCLLCWPGKLSLVPRLGDVIGDRLASLRPRREPWLGVETRHLGWAEPPYLAAGTDAESESAAKC